MSGSVGDHCPCSWHVYAELETSLQVRLIEAWECHARIHRNKQGVNIFVTIIFIFIARERLARRRYWRLKVQHDRVFADTQAVLPKSNMSVLRLDWHINAIDLHFARASFAIVKKQRNQRLELKGQFFVSRNC